jgi:hypothetical protein
MNSRSSTIKVDYSVPQAGFLVTWLVIFVCMVGGAYMIGNSVDQGSDMAPGFASTLFTGMAILLGLALGPIIAFRIKAGKDAQKVAEVAAGFKAEFNKYVSAPLLYSDFGGVLSGSVIIPTAIGFDGERVYILQSGLLKVMTRDDIRSWQWKIEAANFAPVVSKVYIHQATRQVFHTPVDITAGIANAAAQRAANGRSGFFVKCKDIENPTWQFVCTNRRMLEKWAEILEQFSAGEFQKEAVAAAG